MRAAILCLLIAACSGCATGPRPPAAPARDATASLLRHPEFGAAARAAPKFTAEALDTITRYEREIAARND
jgi:hypothetical protein